MKRQQQKRPVSPRVKEIILAQLDGATADFLQSKEQFRKQGADVEELEKRLVTIIGELRAALQA